LYQPVRDEEARNVVRDALQHALRNPCEVMACSSRHCEPNSLAAIVRTLPMVLLKRWWEITGRLIPERGRIIRL
jgi:hypothetical protein